MSDFVVARNCCIARMFPGEAELDFSKVFDTGNHHIL